MLTVRGIWRDLLRTIADLRLAIILLLVIAAFSATGTVIEQGRSLEFYQENYPENPALFGFLTWKVIAVLGLNEVYTTWWFVSLMILFGASLAACTYTRQLPSLKAARHWNYYEKPKQYQRLALSTELPGEALATVQAALDTEGYKVFQEGDKLYARKGLLGKIAPIGVHASMLLILVGSLWGAFGGFLAQEMVPSGETFQVQNIIEAGKLSQGRVPKDWGVRVNRFWIDYTDTGDIDQFYSDLSIVDRDGQERDRKTIFVNEPLRYGGVTFYQTDWGIAAIKVRANNSPIFEIPMQPLQKENVGRLWGTWVPIKPDLSEGVALVAKDLNGTLLAYNQAGEFIGATRAGGELQYGSVTLKIQELVGSTGLQIKSDPGVPIVYAGFGFLMLGVLASYISHSQIWAYRDGDRLYLGGKTNRAQVGFEREFFALLDRIGQDLASASAQQEEAAV
ncbi:MAG: cytochrome c biogenesis protein [Cyanobacteria bacterium J06641_5]